MNKEFADLYIEIISTSLLRIILNLIADHIMCFK
jgi:hypothetical protein